MITAAAEQPPVECRSEFKRFFDLLMSDGFFVWPSLLDYRLIDEHLAAFTEVNRKMGVVAGDNFLSYSEEKQQAIKKARYQFHDGCEATQRLLFNPQLVAFLRQLFHDEPVMRQPETGFYHRGSPDHTDSLDFKVHPKGAEVRIWCALEDVNPEAGPVYFVPGSHRCISDSLEDEVLTEHPEFVDLIRSQMGPTTAPDYYKMTRPMWRFVKRDKLPRAIETRSLERKPLILRKGDVIVFSSDVVHGTSPCRNQSLTRKYLIAFLAARQAIWYQSRAYWGSKHDFRAPENGIRADTELTQYGYRMHFTELHASYMASFKRAVVTG